MMHSSRQVGLARLPVSSLTTGPPRSSCGRGFHSWGGSLMTPWAFTSSSFSPSSSPSSPSSSASSTTRWTDPRLAAASSSTSSTSVVPYSTESSAEPQVPELNRGDGSRKRRLVVLGCGWAGYRIARDIDKRYTDVTVISPRNHFLFTPLLASTTVGTLEFRSIIEPVRDIADIEYLQASAKELDLQKGRLLCQSIFDKDIDESPLPKDDKDKQKFWLGYDDLVIAVGGHMQTFGIKGVAQHAHFLKELNHARSVRMRLLHCFERANEPLTSHEEKRRLLHFVVVGGGPTGVEFAAELYDFLRQDVKRAFTAVQPYVRVTLIEASNSLLTSFDARLSSYAKKVLQNHQVAVLTGVSVKEIDKGTLILSNNEKMDFGLCVWSTGIAPQEFVKGLPFSKDKAGRIHTDNSLNVVSGKDGAKATLELHEAFKNIWAVGDCSSTLINPLPSTAQVANQEAKYVAQQINLRARSRPETPFKYQSSGMLAYVGGYEAISDLPWAKISGFKSWLLWRSAYMTNLISWSNKILVAMHWFKTFLFGRDVSQF